MVCRAAWDPLTSHYQSAHFPSAWSGQRGGGAQPAASTHSDICDYSDYQAVK